MISQELIFKVENPHFTSTIMVEIRRPAARDCLENALALERISDINCMAGVTTGCR